MEGRGGAAYQRRWYGRSILRCFGFFATRFVSAESPDVARDAAIRQVEQEARSLTLETYPWRITVERVELADSSVPGAASGFTFYDETIH